MKTNIWTSLPGGVLPAKLTGQDILQYRFVYCVNNLIIHHKSYIRPLKFIHNTQKNQVWLQHIQTNQFV